MGEERDTEGRILDAVVTLLSKQGMDGVSMRAVAREADVALGLMNYYYDGKTALIAAALRRIGDQDSQLIPDDPGEDAEEATRQVLRRVADEEFLQSEYLGARLQLWALAPIDPVYAQINNESQTRYRDRLATLIASARPGLRRKEALHRATDVVVIQNGMWLTALILGDRAGIERSVRLCEDIALA
ncbi:MAG: TetR family transcriptional regulator [Actinomycetota bacterium]|nr:TetR family transcriptional regulator [Actinomycetota bacterium]MDH5279027.1 TetR family transcriptional regulator [Actinomycetota bacterium]